MSKKRLYTVIRILRENYTIEATSKEDALNIVETTNPENGYVKIEKQFAFTYKGNPKDNDIKYVPVMDYFKPKNP